MLKVEKGNVTVCGEFTELMAEYATLTKAIYDGCSKNIPGEIVKDMLKKSFEVAFKSREEVSKDVFDAIDRIINIMKTKLQDKE